MKTPNLGRRSALGAGLVLLSACSLTTGAREPAAKFTPQASPRRAGAATILVLMPEGKNIQAVWDPLRDELAEEFNVVPHVLPRDVSPDAIGNLLAKEQPRCLVLMDNTVVRAYRDHQVANRERDYPPAVVLLTSYLEEIQPSIRNVTGVAYEVPAITSVSVLRTLLTVPLERIGVVHREGFGRFVQRQKSLAEIEKIRILGVPVPNEPSAQDLKSALIRLRDHEQVDALWVLNDNALLSDRLLRDGWVPFLAQRPIPTVVGVAALVTPDTPFGTMAVLPALEPLAVQAATMVYDIAESGWVITSRVEQPLSINTILDLKRARENFGFNESNLGQVARVIR